jgi:hypothetical protein
MRRASPNKHMKLTLRSASAPRWSRLVPWQLLPATATEGSAPFYWPNAGGLLPNGDPP